MTAWRQALAPSAWRTFTVRDGEKGPVAIEMVKCRVQTHLDEALAIRTPEDINNIDVYVCGLKEMVDDVRKELKQRGFDRKQIIYEKYD